MSDQPSSRIKWQPRDDRQWEVLSAEEDQLTARLVCTYLETNGIEARVGSRGGQYTVEVPEEQLAEARSLHGQDPSDTNIVNLPALQETSTVRSSQTTVRRIRQELMKRGKQAEEAARGTGIARALALLAALLAIMGAVAWLVLWRA